MNDPLKRKLDHHGHDPIQQSFREAPDFNRIWLTDKQPLTNVQSLGLVLLSAFMGLGGAMFTSDGISDMRAGDTVLGFLMTLLGLASLCLGICGLWRVVKDLFLRKQHQSDQRPDDLDP